jgi:phosphate transport system permease protein
MPGSKTRGTRDGVGTSLTYLCGGALALNLLLIVGLLALLAWHGLGYFWQDRVVELTLDDGSRVAGEIQAEESVALTSAAGVSRDESRIQLKTGNRDFFGIDFRWVDASRVVGQSEPSDLVLLERLEWGNFYGRLLEIRKGDEVLASGPDGVWEALPALREQKEAQFRRIERLEKGDIGDVNHEIERLRLERKKAGTDARRAEIDAALAAMGARFESLISRLDALRDEWRLETVLLEAADGSTRTLPVGSIVRAIRPNDMGLLGRLGLYLDRLREFLLDAPRESNTEGGIFPAIFGTVLMVFLMSVAVVPLGVLAALYLREYAKQGLVVRMVRIAVNNLAGVPSIVFGVFGLGFFVYLIGGSIDALLYPERLPSPTYGTGGILWASLTLALLTVPVVIVATEEGLAAVPRIVREGSLALGATKLETTWKVVVPAAAPGILTGTILAMARAAGEVAPLMIVGMVKLAPSLPLDHHVPFLHLERKFMHLGFHIYDLGFQSPNVEATKPLVFATALLLIAVVTVINLVAIAVRNRLRRKYASAAV